MKLFEIYNRVSLFVIVLVIFGTGVVYYYTIGVILTSQVDKDLEVEENEIFDYVRTNHTLPQVFKSDDQQIYFKPIANTPVERRFINTTFRNEKEKENESGRGLISSVVVKNQNYEVHITESKVETEDLVRIIFLITIALVVLIVVILYFINRLLIIKLWKPFYSTLQQLRLFNLTDRDNIEPTDSKIEEFKELNTAVSAMSLRVKDDYQNLKHFIDNASHELLTPVAVINSKLDTLVQTGTFNERQSELLTDLYETVTRLTRLNKAMLLLTKIENNLVNDTQAVNLKPAIEAAISQFHDFFSDKSLTVSTYLRDVTLTISKSLLDVLLSNLLTNAIRHNKPGGQVVISLNENQLMIKNTGADIPLDSNLIFQRFKKSTESEGNGLGLTLSQQICVSYRLKLTYDYIQPFHTFSVIF